MSLTLFTTIPLGSLSKERLCVCHDWHDLYGIEGFSWQSADQTVPINQIRELRLGQPPTDNANASRWITVVYVRSSQWKVLHMIALTDDVYKLWVDTLSRLVSETSDRMVGHGTPSDPDTAWIRQLWPAGAKSIDWSVAVGLCRSIGLVVPQNRDGTPVSLIYS